MLAEADGHLRQKLQQVLKLSKEKWDEARDHAMRAVVADNRMRIWYADNGSMEVGLLFTCRLGTVDLDRPVGLLTKKASDGAQTTMEATLMAQQTPVQREQVRALQPQATAAWWQHGHPGWAIYPVDSDQFMATGTLDPASLPSADAIGPLPGPMHSGMPAGPMSGGAFGLNAAFASAFANLAAPTPGGVPNDMLLRAIGAAPYLAGSAVPQMSPPFVPGVLPAGAGMHMRGPVGGAVPGAGDPPATTSPFAEVQPGRQQAMPGSNGHAAGHLAIGQQQQQQAQQGQRMESPVSGSPPAGTSAFAVPAPKLAPSLENMPSFNLGNLQAMLGGSDFKLPFSMQGFPSLPAAGLPGSGDLEQLLAQHGGDPLILGSGRFPSLALGKFGSVDVPGGGNAAKENVQGEAARGNNPSSGGGTGLGGATSLQRRHSGLESMQSIEVALADVQRPPNMHDAIDAAVREVTRGGGTLSGSKRK